MRKKRSREKKADKTPSPPLFLSLSLSVLSPFSCKKLSYKRTFSPFFLPFAPIFCVAARTVAFIFTIWTLVAAVTFVPTREVVNMI